MGRLKESNSGYNEGKKRLWGITEWGEITEWNIQACGIFTLLSELRMDGFWGGIWRIFIISAISSIAVFGLPLGMTFSSFLKGSCGVLLGGLIEFSALRALTRHDFTRA